MAAHQSPTAAPAQDGDGSWQRSDQHGAEASLVAAALRLMVLALYF
jgi:hypothetical protein